MPSLYSTRFNGIENGKPRFRVTNAIYLSYMDRYDGRSNKKRDEDEREEDFFHIMYRDINVAVRVIPTPQNPADCLMAK